MPGEHAVLSASASTRWLNCPPSALFERKFPATTSVFAEEGTKAHAWGEYRLKTHFRIKGRKKPPDPDQDMKEYVQQYVDTVIEKYNGEKAAKHNPVISIEQHLDFSPWVPKGWGTGDAVIISNACIEIIDLKYGKGVPVHAEGNTQMRLYALGCLHVFDMLYEPQTVRMTIVQPRIGNIDTEEITAQDLLAWGDSIKPVAQEAIHGKGDFKAGDHCRFCRARNTCRVLKEYLLNDIHTDKRPDELTDAEIVDVLKKSGEIKKYLTGLDEYALDQALKLDKHWPGMKLVEGRSIRKIVDVDRAIDCLLQSGLRGDEIYKPSEIKSITELEKLTGKKRFAEILADNIQKPPGKPTLVPMEDRRPEISVLNDFDDSLLPKGE